MITQVITRGDEIIATAEVEAACITPDGRPRRPQPDLVRLLTPLLVG